MEHIKFEDVKETYNGKPGCACGCNGRYTLPSHADVDQLNQECGYAAYNDSDVSDRRVKIAITKINKAIDRYRDLVDQDGEYSDPETGLWFKYSAGQWVSCEQDRVTTVYLK